MYKLSFCLPEADTESSHGLWHQTCPKLWHHWSLWCNGFSLNFDPQWRGLSSRPMLRWKVVAGGVGGRVIEGESLSVSQKYPGFYLYANRSRTAKHKPPCGYPSKDVLSRTLYSALFPTPPPYIYPVLTVCKVTVMALSGQSDAYITKLFSSFVTVSSQYIN